MIKSPISHFEFKEFDFSPYLAYKREGFVGREWLFSELESIFEDNQVNVGVLITGDPGSGKSALMSQLICSPYSNILIHDNTIGYHLCEYAKKGTRDGARFVRNLVDQIGARIPEYSKHVMNNEQIRTELNKHCHKDLTSCFFTTIVGPLRKLGQPDGLRFIVIDALDECFEGNTKTSEIMEMLQRNILDFPKWLKIILTSRNVTSVTSSLPQMQINRMPLYATDERNVDDIRFYVSRFISQNTDFSHRLWMAFGIGSKSFLNKLITRAEGNFLFVKMTLQYMKDAGGKFDFNSLSTSLFDLYDSFFKRQFGEDEFWRFRSIFEVLLAVYSPLLSQDVQEILESEYKMENIPALIEQVSVFLRFGRDGTVRLFHRSFADWLINQTTVLGINKTRGHQSIATFLLRRVRERHVDVTFEELTELFMHILSGQAFEMQETAMNLFNITEMREPQTNQSILHYLVTQPTIYLPVLDFFSHKFQTVDILDYSNKTPAFYAASQGFVRSLQICINNGADINSFLKGYTEIDLVSAVLRNTGIEDFSLIHAAAANGHSDVVELLTASNVSTDNSKGYYPTPLHVAAGNGHLNVVKLFYDHNVTFDLITLHHAAARNHSDVVKFLLHTVGLRDTCIPCEMDGMTTIQEAHSYFCETALHAAVSRGLDDVVEVLLEYGNESLECTQHSGKTVLMYAVERNDTEMVDLLLRHGADVAKECGSITWRNSDMCSIYSMSKQDFLYTVYCGNKSCGDGYKAIHISGKYGFWKVAQRLLSGRIDEISDLRNWDGHDATDVATIYDQKDFVQNVDISAQKIRKYICRSASVQFAAKYCSVNVAKFLLFDPFDDKDSSWLIPFDHRDETVWDILLQSVKWSPCENVQTKRFSESHCIKAFEESNLSEAEKTKMESQRRLDIITLFVGTYGLSFEVEDTMTLLHYASSHGFEDAVKYLVDRGADELSQNQHGDTPLMIALKKSPVNDIHPSASYRCYTTDDGQFRSCNTTCYDETARYLIQLQKSRYSKCDTETKYILEQVVVKRMPLSLYALLKIGVNSKCIFNESGSLMLLHLQEGGREVSEVLNMFDVDITLKCGVSFSKSELHRVSLRFQPSSNKKLFPVQRLIDRHPRGVRTLDECFDAEGYLPIHRAAQGGNLAAIKWFKSIGVNTQLKTRSGLTALEISLRSLKSSVKTNWEYRHECFEELLRSFFDTSRKNYSSDFSSFLFSKYPILHSASRIGLDVLIDVWKKALEIIPSLKKKKFLLLDEQDENGNTPLHIAAGKGLEDVVEYLVRLGADTSVKNKEGNTPLHIAAGKGFGDVVKYLVRLGADTSVKNKEGNTPLLTALSVSSANINIAKLSLNQHCYITNGGLFNFCRTTSHDEIVRYLLWLQKSSISKCDTQSAYLLNQVILKRLHVSLHALLEIGVDINCHGNEYLSLLLQHIKVGGPKVSEVLKIFEVDVSVKCLIPFSFSELHLISYVSTIEDFGNFFQPSLNNKRFPLQRLIDHHPRGVRILDECYDAEGYLPIHRAAQGGNLAAVKWFKSIGVNTQLKTRSGLTALDISILYLGDIKYAELTAPSKYRYLSGFYREIPVTMTKYRRQVFDELLRTILSTTPEYRLGFPCRSTLEGLSPLHIAAVKGITVLRYVHKKASEIFPSLPINCLNKHRLDPVYLAHLYESIRNEGVKDILRYTSEDDIGNTQETDQNNINEEFTDDNVPAVQHPDREVEYIIVSDYLYHLPRETTEEELLYESKDVRLSDCPGYYDNFPKFEEAVSLENSEVLHESECEKIRVHRDYHWSLCTHNCPNMQKQLLWWFTGRKRNRRVSLFILKRLGWSIGWNYPFHMNNNHKRWPFYFLHKMLRKEYEAYEYLRILNNAFEIADIRFNSRSIFETRVDP